MKNDTAETLEARGQGHLADQVRVMVCCPKNREVQKLIIENVKRAAKTTGQAT